MINPIAVVFIDHNNVEKEIYFPNRNQYKTWKREQQMERKRGLGTSFFKILTGYQDSKTRDQDLLDTMMAIRARKNKEKEIEEENEIQKEALMKRFRETTDPLEKLRLQFIG